MAIGVSQPAAACSCRFPCRILVFQLQSSTILPESFAAHGVTIATAFFGTPLRREHLRFKVLEAHSSLDDNLVRRTRPMAMLPFSIVA
jgi:hypothetical protein